MRRISRILVVNLGEKVAKQIVNATSPAFCYQPKEPEEARKKFLCKEK